MLKLKVLVRPDTSLEVSGVFEEGLLVSMGSGKPPLLRVLDRDYNAASNIQRRAGMVRTDACAQATSVDEESHRQAASLKQEAPSLTAG